MRSIKTLAVIACLLLATGSAFAQRGGGN